ncbi:DNA double-strand break repair Rad50 ATPase [uncultured archaeon]|nr:DNA double-strand break repair Rad50 ATPase [uncultured archaeon]
MEKNLSELLLDTKEIARLSKEGCDAAGIDSQLAVLDGKLQELEAESEKSENTLSQLEKQVEQSRKSHEKALRTLKLFEDLEAAQAKLSELEQKLSLLQFDEAKYEQQRRETEALRLEHANAASEQRAAEQSLALLESMLAVLEKEMADLAHKERLSKKYAQAAESTTIYKNSLAFAQSELRRLLVEEINAALAEIWPSVYPYSDYGAIKFEADEKDYRLLMQKGEWREVDAVASGGERACLCLALRIAFATVLTPDIGWLILDEPTHNLDSEAVQLLSEAINDKIPSIVEQTFVITHEQQLGETGQGNVFRLERDKNKNENTKVVRA